MHRTKYDYAGQDPVDGYDLSGEINPEKLKAGGKKIVKVGATTAAGVVIAVGSATEGGHTPTPDDGPGRPKDTPAGQFDSPGASSGGEPPPRKIGGVEITTGEDGIPVVRVPGESGTGQNEPGDPDPAADEPARSMIWPPEFSGYPGIGTGVTGFPICTFFCGVG
jgi:hypothetical protein